MQIVMQKRPWKIRNLTGQRFGRLIAIEQNGQDMHRRVNWLCLCDCGNRKTVPSRHLVNYRIRSCGCLGAENAARNGKNGKAKISGAKSHLYKHHLTNDDRLQERNLVEVREWRKAVYKLADFTCDICGVKGGRLEAHHLYSWSTHKEHRFDIKNGVCLCRKHHKDFHDSIGGPRQPCTESQYIKFKEVRLELGL